MSLSDDVVGSNRDLLALLAIVVVGAGACAKKDPAAVEAQRLDKALVTAWAMSTEFVSQRLKSPGTADYGSFSKGTFQPAKERCKELVRDKQYRCSGWVDSQNGFGAIVRTNWDVTIANEGGEKWSLVQLHKLE